MDYVLFPSDLTFLYDGCKRCFVHKVRDQIAQPSIPIPQVFSIIARLQKETYENRRTEEVDPDLPRGVFILGEQNVRSRVLSFPSVSGTCRIVGRLDMAIRLDEGGFALIDFKTGVPSEEKTRLYARQLHAYAWALEQPDGDSPALIPVRRLGLIYFVPYEVVPPWKTGGAQLLGGTLEWREIPRDDEAFRTFLTQVIRLLEGPLPAAAPGCPWCRYVRLVGGRGVPVPGKVSSSAGPRCPHCGGPMKKKTGRRGPFWSCLRYPNCRGSMDYP